MDTFSSTVSSTFKVPPLPQTSNREFCYQFKRTPYAPTQPHVSSSLLPKSNNNPNFSHKRCSTSSLPFSNSSSKTSSSHLLLLRRRQQQQQPSSPIFHSSPATGYAAAILDVAQTTNSLHLVHRDVQRILRFLHQSDFVEKQVIRQVVQEQGKFHRHVVTLLKMLLKKNKIGILNQVLQEFERIYAELCGTQVVLVPFATKIGEEGAATKCSRQGEA